MAAFVAFAVGCSAAPGSEVQIAEGSAEFSQSNLVVKLDANPTTGYEWTFQIDGSAVQPDGDEFVPASDGAQPKTGEGGRAHVQLQSRRLGRGYAYVHVARSWEASDSDKSVVLHASGLETARSRRLKSRRKHQRAGTAERRSRPFSCGLL